MRQATSSSRTSPRARTRSPPTRSGYGHDARQIIIGDSAPEDVQFRLSPSDGITIRAVDTRDNTALTVNVLRVVDAQGNELPSGPGFFGSSEVVKLPLAPGTYRVTVIGPQLRAADDLDVVAVAADGPLLPRRHAHPAFARLRYAPLPPRRLRRRVRTA